MLSKVYLALLLLFNWREVLILYKKYERSTIMLLKKVIIPLAILIFIISCTQTRVVSFSDPEAKYKSYGKIAVIGDTDDLSDRLTIENKMVETLQDNGVKAVASLSLLPPTRSFTIEQENAILTDNNIQALVLIQVADAGFYVRSEPISIHTEKDEDGKETTISGGGTEQKAYSKLRITLIDIESGQNMWIGDADAQSFFDTADPDWDMNYLLKASSKKLAKELIKTGMIQTNN